MKSIALTLFLLPAFLLSGNAAELNFSGRLAQSQPETVPPIREMTPAGITSEPGTANAIALFGKTLYRLKPNQPAEKLLDIPGIPGFLFHDGARIFIVNSAQAITPLICQDGVWRLQRDTFFLKRSGQAFTVSDAKTTKGFAAKGKFFSLDKNTREITAFDSDGASLGTVLQLPELAQDCTYFGLFFQPETGDLLVSGYYPDRTLYRFHADGTQQKSGGWPLRDVWVHHGTVIDGKVAGFENGVSIYPENPVTQKEIVNIGDGLDTYTFGAAPDGNGGYYLATSTGVKQYPAGSAKEAAKRYGGTGDILALALNGNTVVASVGNQLYGLKLGDNPDSPFFSFGNEPWLTGGSWDGIGAEMVRNGEGFLVLDSKTKALWQFNPAKEGKERWAKLNRELKNPTAFSAFDGKVFVVEGGAYGPVADVVNIAALDADAAAVSSEKQLALVRNNKVAWKTDLPGIRSLATMQGKFIVAATGKELLLLNAANGKIEAKTASPVTKIAADGKWLIGFDPAGSVILRYKLQ